MKKLIALALLATALVQTNSYAIFGRGYGYGSGACCPTYSYVATTVCCPEVVTTTYCC